MDLKTLIKLTESFGTEMKYDGLSYTFNKRGQVVVTEADEMLNATILEGAEIIENMVFCRSSLLKSVEMSNSVTAIGMYAFSDCYNLMKVGMSSNITKIAMGAFENCTRLKNIEFPSGLKRIAPESFTGCVNLQTVTFPDALEEIGSFAFHNCKSLEFVNLSKVKRLGRSSFKGCDNLKQVILPKGLSEKVFDSQPKIIYEGVI